MCGIYFCYGCEDCPDLKNFEEQCKSLINRRGPDVQSLFQCGRARALSTVLWLQGKSPYKQPVVTDRSCFLWNGDVFKFGDEILSTDQSDTEFIHAKLTQCSTDRDLLRQLEQIQGPWAFVLWDREKNILWYGRDMFGRQSLLILRSEAGVVLASCAPQSEVFKMVEVPADGIFKLDLNDMTRTEPVLYPWDCMLERLNMDCPLVLSSPVKICTVDSRDQVAVTFPTESASIFDELLSDPEVSRLVDTFTDKLTSSVRTRIEHQPDFCKLCVKERLPCRHPCVGVLFSGGLDSTVIAVLAGMLMKEQGNTRDLDLLNVAFASDGSSFDVPDRLTGQQALQEMQEILPEVNIRLVRVNVTKKELQLLRTEKIKDLLNPLETVLDDGIGCSIWFAARGAGEAEGVQYQSPCRVQLSGLGIDEQLGGYVRHRSRYQEEGLLGLEAELRMEILRISKRNLGRDNRIISDHGVMARFPFLDEELVNFLGSVPTLLKCNLDLPRGVGEKLILRLVAHRLGLVKTAREPKRAVQFGSRIAKLENRKEKAGDVAIRD